MRATGNNKLKEIKRVSIQSSLNGLSFYGTSHNLISEDIRGVEHSVDAIRKLRKSSNRVLVTVETDNFIIHPVSLYNSEDKELYFKTKKLPFDSERYEYIESELFDGIVEIVFALEKEVFDSVESTFDDIVYTHPMVEVLGIAAGVEAKRSAISLFSTAEYVAVAATSRGQLLFCDYIKIASYVDIAYYVKVLMAEKDMHPDLLICEGVDAKPLAGLLGEFHPAVEWA